MKISPASILAWVCLVLAAFLTGMFIGRNITGGTIQTTVLATQATTQPTQQTDTTPSNSSAPAASGKININTADLYTLMTLEGIGEVYAQRIIDYRTANGPFQDITELKNVDGIGDKRFELIKDYITTGG